MLSLKPSGGVARCGSKALKSSYSLEGAGPPCLTKGSCIPVHVTPCVGTEAVVYMNPQWLLEQSP